jgi:predicted amino acid-binding ACT domain protein
MRALLVMRRAPLVGPRLTVPQHTQARCAASASASSAASRNILFKVTGSDKLGVVASFSRVLSNHDAQIMDVDQSACTVHSTFSLDLLARCPPSGDVIQDMLITAQDMGVKLQVVALEAAKMRSDGSDALRYRLTLFNRGLSFDSLATVSEAAAQAGLSIERMDRLTPLDPMATRPPTALRIVLEAGGTPGLEPIDSASVDIDAFVQSLRSLQSGLDCHLLLEGGAYPLSSKFHCPLVPVTWRCVVMFPSEHHVPGRPGFNEDVINNVQRKDLLLKLSPTSVR